MNTLKSTTKISSFLLHNSSLKWLKKPILPLPPKAFLKLTPLNDYLLIVVFIIEYNTDVWEGNENARFLPQKMKMEHFIFAI